MSHLKLPVPLVEAAYYDTGDVAQIRAALDAIDDNLSKKYNLAIASIASLTKVPAMLLRSKVFTESRGDAKIVSSAGAVGLTQVKPQTAAATLFIEVRGDKNRGLAGQRLSAEERRIIVATIGEAALKRIEACRNLGEVGQLQPAPVTVEHLKNPQFNLLVGALALGQAIDLHHEDGTVRLDLVIADYGRGRGALRAVPATAKATPESFMRYIRGRKGWGEVATSIVKIGGRNGLLEIQHTA